MAEHAQQTARVNQSAGHLSVHVEGAHPPGVIFSFEQRNNRLLPSFLSAGVLQFTVISFLVLLSRYGPTIVSTPAVLPDKETNGIIWLAQEGPGGGGGGGGNKMKEPPRVAELPGKDKISVPVQKPPALDMPKPKPEPEPEPQLAQINIPAVTLGASNESLPGLIDAPSASSIASQGTGSGGGAGTGRGTGSGSGTGSGLGAGSGGGTGGGVYAPGSLSKQASILHQERPEYTADAMRAKIQGIVVIGCIVQADGKATDLKVIRSLGFGLDEKAIDTVRKWVFRPAMRMEQPVASYVTIELSFNLR
jgi:periplasmic protein TonB